MSHTILVVDDSEIGRMEIVKGLRARSFDVIEADNGRRAFEIASEGGVHLIVSDIHMPIMNGIEMCEAIAASTIQPKPPIIVVSTEASDELKRRGKAAGVRGWVIKPVDVTKLITAIDLILAKGAK